MNKLTVKLFIVLIVFIALLTIRINIEIIAEGSSAMDATSQLKGAVTGLSLACSSLFAFSKLLAERRGKFGLIQRLNNASEYILYALLTAIFGFFFLFSVFPVEVR